MVETKVIEAVKETAKKEYTYEEVLEASTKYFGGDELAGKVFADKYSVRQILGDNKSIFYEKDPKEMHERLAREFHRIEQKYPNPLSYEEIFALLDGFKYIIPQGSPMSVIGNPYQVSSSSNCVVLPKIYDSYGGIGYADQQLAQLSKRRAGVGIDISPIRPKGTPVLNAALTTDGIGVYMERFSNTIREVGQNGRRGALMQTISVHHPEILNFATIKNDPNKVTGANISIFLTDEFLEAVEKGKTYEQRWPVDSKTPKISQQVDARSVWNKIIHSAWFRAEPGLMFIDRIKEYTPTSSYEGWEPHSTNPCSEIAMNADTCRLTAINMASFVENPFTEDAKFDFKKWEEVVFKTQRIMDDLVDLEIECMERIIAKVNADPEPQHIKQIELDTWQVFLKHAKEGRRTGLGITGLGDTLAYMGIRYGSDESIKFVDKAFKMKKVTEYTSSVQLAKERGAFPLYDFEKEKDNKFIAQLFKDAPDSLEADMKKYGRRNIAISTVAPTGSLSTLTQTTSGVEPAFEVSYIRSKKINPNDQNAKVDYTDAQGDKWQNFSVFHHGFAKWMEVTGLKDPEKSPYHKSLAHQLVYSERVKIQATMQKHIDHAISSTVNLPKDATEEDVSTVYTTAWAAGCKGITVYRDGCRDGVLKTSASANPENDIIESHAPKRPDVLQCDVHRANVSGKPWYCFVGLLNGKPYEIFAGLEKDIVPPKSMEHGVIVKRAMKASSKYDIYFNKDQEDEISFKDITHHFTNEAFSTNARVISMCLRHGIPVQFVVDQLQKDENEELFSFNKVVARVLKKYIADGTSSSSKCSSCGKDGMVYQEGCATCKSCGYSKCS
jgi:ribonucleoside-diphosphate reductase alpha chain